MPGIGVSVVLVAIGAILDFAVTANTEQHGFNINTVGLILMIVGGVGLLISLVVYATGEASWRGTRRHRTVVDDGQGHVVRRDEVYQ